MFRETCNRLVHLHFPPFKSQMGKRLFFRNLQVLHTLLQLSYLIKCEQLRCTLWDLPELQSHSQSAVQQYAELMCIAQTPWRPHLQ